MIMLGTNDAKDPGSRGPSNWQHGNLSFLLAFANFGFCEHWLLRALPLSYDVIVDVISVPISILIVLFLR